MVSGLASAMVSASDPTPAVPSAEPTIADLVAQLSEDRLWLLRQLDAGCWPQWRLDLAALERELGQLLDQARERQDG